MSLKKKLTSSLSKHGKDTEVVKLMVNICSLIDEWQKEVQNFTPASQEVEQQIQTFVSKLNSVKSPVKSTTTKSPGSRDRKGTISEKNLPSIIDAKGKKETRRNSVSLPKGIKGLQDIQDMVEDTSVDRKKIDKKPEKKIEKNQNAKFALKLELPRATYTESAPEINLTQYLNTDRVQSSTKKKARKDSLPASVILSPRRQRRKEEKSKLAASELPSPRGQDSASIKSPRGSRKNREKLVATLDDAVENNKKRKASKKKKEKNSENSEKIIPADPVESKLLSPIKNNPEPQTPEKRDRQKSKKSRKMAELLFENVNTPDKVPPINMEELKSPSVESKRTQRAFGEKARTKVPKEKAKIKTSPKAKDGLPEKIENNQENKQEKNQEILSKKQKNSEKNQEKNQEKNPEKILQKKEKNSEIDKNLSELSENSGMEKSTTEKSEQSVKRKHKRTKSKTKTKSGSNSEIYSENSEKLSETSENSAKDDLSFSSGAGMVDMNELLSSLNTLEQQDPGAVKTDFGFDLNFDIPAGKTESNFYQLDSLNSINNIENLNLLLQKTEEKSTDQATLPDFDLGGLESLSFALPATEDPFAGINLAAALSAPPPEPVQAVPAAAAPSAAPAAAPLSYDDFFAAFAGSKKVEEAPVVIHRDGSLIRSFSLKEDMNRKGMQRIKKKSVATGLKNKGAYQMEVYFFFCFSHFLFFLTSACTAGHTLHRFPLQ